MDITDTKAVDDKPVFNPSLTAAQWSQTKQTRSTVDTIEDNIAATIDANPIQMKKKDTLYKDAHSGRDAAKSALNLEPLDLLQQEKGEDNLELQLSDSEVKEQESKYKEEIQTSKKQIEHPLEDQYILSARLDNNRSEQLVVIDTFNHQ